jgi:hypothetical protein
LNASDYAIKDLNLIILNVFCNKKITNINHMNKLINLDASGFCYAISDIGIKSLNKIRKLNVKNNKKVTNINHMNLE